MSDPEGDPDDFVLGGVVSVTSVDGPEPDEAVRRLAMDAVWCTDLELEPEYDFRVQKFDEKVSPRLLKQCDKADAKVAVQLFWKSA
jgi:hypothetical protein